MREFALKKAVITKYLVFPLAYSELNTAFVCQGAVHELRHARGEGSKV